MLYKLPEGQNRRKMVQQDVIPDAVHDFLGSPLEYFKKMRSRPPLHKRCICIIYAIALCLATATHASFLDGADDIAKSGYDISVSKVNPLIITPPVIISGQCPYAKFFKPAPEVPAFQISSAVLDASAQLFLPQVNYLQMTIDFSFVQPVYLALNASSPKPILNRGEAHITVITPPEFSVLQLAGVTIEDINQIALDSNIQASKYCITCVGKNDAPIGLNGAYESSYQIIVYSNDLIAIRQKIWELYVSKGGFPSRFNAANIFGPHITLGFTVRDLFESDGITKFDNSCWGGIKLVD